MDTYAGTTSRILAISLGIVCAIIAIALWFASRSRWGQNKPLTNCIVLAVLAHVWLLMYAYGTRVVPHGPKGNGSGQSFVSNSIEWMDVPTEPFEAPPETSEAASDHFDIPPALLVVAPEIETPSTESPSNVTTPGEQPETTTTGLEADSSHTNVVQDVPPNNVGHELVSQDLTSETVLPIGQEASLPLVSSSGDSLDQISKQNQHEIASSTKIVTHSAKRSRPDQQPIPESYQLRFSESRLATAQQFGGDASTEAAVESALKWLAENQEADGSWDASKHGGGRETRTLERDRAGTGSKADTAMTGLAMLAFLGAGYTQTEGVYRDTVEAGLRYLIASQMPSGDMAGLKQIGNTSDVFFARMYCHGMATLALAEAYAMTGDRRLIDPVQRAVAYTLRAQNPRSGGWRYQAFATDDPGDTSQFGWQAMAILSSQNGGFTIPAEVTTRMHGYLSRVAVGQHGGLAVYRPFPGQSPSQAMTAEALAMRFMLRQPTSNEAIFEAKRYMFLQMPGSGEENLYFWYYASLALCQLQDAEWQTWNQALKTHLTQTQSTNGRLDGSWDPRCIWAGYGGRIYSTAMSCLCLEVYYRYLPLYRKDSVAATTGSELRR